MFGQTFFKFLYSFVHLFTLGLEVFYTDVLLLNGFLQTVNLSLQGSRCLHVTEVGLAFSVKLSQLENSLFHGFPDEKGLTDGGLKFFLVEFEPKFSDDDSQRIVFSGANLKMVV